jgi:predicted esterase
VIERIVATAVHGRYLAIPPAAPGPAPILVGFHGYAEDAETQLERLRAIPESTRWLCVSIQALHRFYERRTDRVVASWMTRQDRELAITDNVAYVTTCIDAVAAEWPTIPKVMFAGFSQGVGMAFRAAAHTNRPVAGAIAVGGDIPPELTPSSLEHVSAALIARGLSDDWYTAEKFADDELARRPDTSGCRPRCAWQGCRRCRVIPFLAFQVRFKLLTEWATCMPFTVPFISHSSERRRGIFRSLTRPRRRHPCRNLRIVAPQPLSLLNETVPSN